MKSTAAPLVFALLLAVLAGCSRHTATPPATAPASAPAATMPQEAVQHELEAMRARRMEFVRNRTIAQRTVIQAFDPLIKAGYDSGHHEIVDQWEKSRDDFIYRGELPKDSPEELRQAFKNWQQHSDLRALTQANDEAIRRLTEANQLEPARTLQKQMDELVKSVNRKAATSPATATAPAK